MSYRVRDFDPNDLQDAERLAALFNTFDSVWPWGFTRGIPETGPRINERFRNLAHLALCVAEREDGEFVGFCNLRAQQGQTEVAYIPLLGAHPDYIGQGIGKMLLRETLRRVIEKGFREVTLGTWAGNTKAVPLYKKMGFQWVPDSNVWMRNFIPAILAMPAGRAFFAERDWYACLEREIVVAPDDVPWKGMKVYPYRFRDGDDFLNVIFDAVSGRLTAIETPQYSASCCLPVEEAVAGETYPVTWEITPHEDRKLSVELLPDADPDFVLGSVWKWLFSGWETTITIDLRVAASAAPRREGEEERRIRSTLLLDGQPIELEMGVKVIRPIEINYNGQGLFIGRDERVRIKLWNRMDRTLTGQLSLDPHPALLCTPPEASFTLPARSWTSCTFTVRAMEAGALASQLRYEAGEFQGSRPVSFRAFAGTGALASVDPEEEIAILETPGLRLEVSLRGGELKVHDTVLNRECMMLNMADIGPPFPGYRMRPLLYTARVGASASGDVLTIRAPSPEFPGLIVERSLCLIGEGLVRIDHQVLNTTGKPQSLKLRYRSHLWLDGQLTLPLPDGLIREPLRSWGEYPENDRDVLAPGQKLAESWLARDEEGMVCGVLWPPEVEAEVAQNVMLTADLGEVPPHAVSTLPPVYLSVSGGDWKRVRGWWQRLIAPSGPEEALAPLPGRVLEVRTEPSPLLLGGNLETVRLSVRNRRGRTLNGRLTLTGPTFPVEPSAFSLEAVDRDHPFETEITVSGPAGPAAGFIEASLDTGPSTETFRLPAIQLGTGEPVQVTETPDGQIHIENGFLCLRCAPAHLGALVALERDGVNHLFSSYPTAGPFEQYNPWFGGLHPNIHWGADAQRLARERFDGTSVERVGERGLLWKGARVASDLENKELRFARLEIEYLTLPGSNLVAIVSRWINRTDARMEIYGRLAAWAQPGGTRENTVAHWEQEGKRRSRGRGGYSMDVVSGVWAAVENPATGDAILLITGDPRDHAQLEEIGAEGTFLGTRYFRWLEPNGSVEILSWLLHCQNLDQLDAYAALSQLSVLP